MATISLREITPENWETCVDLKVADEQKNFVASNTYSLVQAHYEPDEKWQALGIYADETMVGFIMFGHTMMEELGGRVWEICRLMVGKDYQAKGYGRAAMVEAIRRMKSQPDCDAIYITFVPENVIGDKLYEALGFESTGIVIEGEIVRRLPVRK